MQPFSKHGDYPFIEAATYPDDIKYLHWNAFDSWHFNDHYWSKDGTSVDITPDPTNIVWAIENCRKTLMSTRKSRLDANFGKSFMLFFLIHLVGDIHQPLHNASLVSRERPKGDRGGNDFKIVTSTKAVDNLHTLWDSCMQKIKEIPSPLTEKHLEYLKE